MKAQDEAVGCEAPRGAEQARQRALDTFEGALAADRERGVLHDARVPEATDGVTRTFAPIVRQRTRGGGAA